MAANRYIKLALICLAAIACAVLDDNKNMFAGWDEYISIYPATIEYDEDELQAISTAMAVATERVFRKHGFGNDEGGSELPDFVVGHIDVVDSETWTVELWDKAHIREGYRVKSSSKSKFATCMEIDSK
jgi:hypothetical protein